jgi:hypothetical protein
VPSEAGFSGLLAGCPKRRGRRAPLSQADAFEARHCQRDAGDGGTLPRHRPEVGRRHCGRRLVVHDPCAPRRRGHRLGPLRDGAERPWRKRPLRRRAHPQCRVTRSLAGQFEQPYGPMGPPTLFTIPVLRYMKTYGLTHEQLAMVSACSANGPPKTRAPPSGRRSRSRTC